MDIPINCKFARVIFKRLTAEGGLLGLSDTEFTFYHGHITWCDECASWESREEVPKVDFPDFDYEVLWANLQDRILEQDVEMARNLFGVTSKDHADEDRQ